MVTLENTGQGNVLASLTALSNLQEISVYLLDVGPTMALLKPAAKTLSNVLLSKVGEGCKPRVSLPSDDSWGLSGISRTLDTADPAQAFPRGFAGHLRDDR